MFLVGKLLVGCDLLQDIIMGLGIIIMGMVGMVDVVLVAEVVDVQGAIFRSEEHTSELQSP